MIQSDIREQMRQAMVEKDTLRLGVLRGLLAGFTNQLVATKRKPDELLTDDEVIEVISKQARQRKDSIEQFEKGNRPDLAEIEKAELSVLETFLPPQMSYKEVLEFVKNKQTKTGMIDKTKAGQFMGLIMKELKGKTDGQVVKQAIDSILS